jgi:thiol-disulfide isomerase/thioredoxin
MYNLSSRLTLAVAVIAMWVLFTGANTGVVKKAAVNFTLQDISGNKVSLNDYRGKVVVINFWATWCGPCLREMPELEKIYQNYCAKNVQILGIAVVSNEKEIPKQIRMTGVTYPILLGNKNLIAEYDYFTSMPHTIIIDPEGNIYRQMEGSQTYSCFEKEINTLLDENSLAIK